MVYNYIIQLSKSISNLRIVYYSTLFSIVIFSFVRGQQYGPISQPLSGYGANGNYTVIVDSFRNPELLLYFCYTYHPHFTGQRFPLIFSCHGYFGVNPDFYKSLFIHLASRGYFVIHSPYSIAPAPTDSVIISQKYKELFAGFERAVQLNKSIIDTTNVTFIGHSFGAGAIPALAWRAINQKGWGNNSVNLFMMAPYYSYEITQEQLQSFPINTKLIMQVYDDDDANDHRMAKDIFNNINVSTSEKDYTVLYSDYYASFPYNFTADHFTPLSSYSNGEEDALDFYGIYKLIDGLLDYSIWNVDSARIYCLGNGSVKQKFMGLYPDGRVLKEILVTDDPIVAKPDSFYTNPWNSNLNPRKNITALESIKVPKPNDFVLFQNFPNPFNPSTWIKYSIPSNVKRETSNVILKVYDVLGNEVATLVNEYKPSGSYEVEFNTSSGIRNLVSGIYFYQLRVDDQIQIKKMILLK